MKRYKTAEKRHLRESRHRVRLPRLIRAYSKQIGVHFASVQNARIVVCSEMLGI